MVPTRKHGPPSVINAGLMRTGTMSMARAYDILGLRAYHGLDMPSMPEGHENKGWETVSRLLFSRLPLFPPHYLEIFFSPNVSRSCT